MSGFNIGGYTSEKDWITVSSQGFISFTSKTELIDHYEKTLGATHIGGQEEKCRLQKMLHQNEHLGRKKLPLFNFIQTHDHKSINDNQ